MHTARAYTISTDFALVVVAIFSLWAGLTIYSTSQAVASDISILTHYNQHQFEMNEAFRETK